MGATVTSLPLGYHFCPTDVELLLGYLSPKIKEQELPSHLIFEVFLYDHEPKELPGLSHRTLKESHWFFFCPLRGKYNKGKKMDRTTKSGFWKVTGKQRDVEEGSRVIGKRTILTYQSDKEKSRNDWVMHEYSLDDRELGGSSNPKMADSDVHGKSAAVGSDKNLNYLEQDPRPSFQCHSENENMLSPMVDGAFVDEIHEFASVDPIESFLKNVDFGDDRVVDDSDENLNNNIGHVDQINLHSDLRLMDNFDLDVYGFMYSPVPSNKFIGNGNFFELNDIGEDPDNRISDYSRPRNVTTDLSPADQMQELYTSESNLKFPAASSAVKDPELLVQDGSNSIPNAIFSDP